MRLAGVAVVGVIVVTATPAHADPGEHGPATLPPTAGEPHTPPAPAATPPTEQRETSASDVDGAPLPGAEGGRLDRVDTPDSVGRVIVRGVLFVPKLLAEVAFAPIRGSLYLLDRYEIDDLYYRGFFNRDRTF